MEESIPAKLTTIAVIIISVAITCFHIVYTADNIASLVGYFISLAILPILVGGLIGCVAATMLGNNSYRGIKTYWWVPASGAIASLAPVLYVMVLMSLAHR